MSVNQYDSITDLKKIGRINDNAVAMYQALKGLLRELEHGRYQDNYPTAIAQLEAQKVLAAIDGEG